MNNKYVLIVLGILSLACAVYGGYARTFGKPNGTLFLVIGVFLTPIFLSSLLLYIKNLNKKQK